MQVWLQVLLKLIRLMTVLSQKGLLMIRVAKEKMRLIDEVYSLNSMSWHNCIVLSKCIY